MRRPIFAISFLLLASCGVGHSETRDSGPETTRSFAVGPFDSVSLEGSDNVRVVRGTAISVSATGSQRVLDALDICVDRNTLKIDRKSDRAHWFRGHDRGATITVTLPALAAAGVAGSGDMTVDRADGDVFGAAVEGSGNLKVMSISVKRAQLAAEGSGNLTISGTAVESAMAAEGSGNIDAKGLVSQSATIAVDGSGNVDAAVRDRATIAVDGSGNVNVTGTTNCTIVKNGSGDARCTR